MQKIFSLHEKLPIDYRFVALAWAVVSLPSNPATRVDSRRGRNFNFCPGTGCVSFVFCLVLSLGMALILCWPHIQGGQPLCLVFWSTVCCSPSRHLTHGIGVVSLGGGEVLYWGRVINNERNSFSNSIPVILWTHRRLPILLQ